MTNSTSNAPEEKYIPYIDPDTATEHTPFILLPPDYRIESGLLASGDEIAAYPRRPDIQWNIAAAEFKKRARQARSAGMENDATALDLKANQAEERSEQISILWLGKKATLRLT